MSFDIDMKVNVQGSQTAIKEINGISAAFEKLRITAAKAMKSISLGSQPANDSDRSSGTSQTASAESQTPTVMLASFERYGVPGSGTKAAPVSYTHVLGNALRWTGKSLRDAVLGAASSKTIDALLDGVNKTVADVLEEERKKITKLQEDLASAIRQRDRLQNFANEERLFHSPGINGVPTDREEIFDLSRINDLLADYDQIIHNLQTKIPKQEDIIAALEEKFARTVEGRVQALDQSFRNYKLTALPLLSKIDRSTFYLYNRLKDPADERQSVHTGGIIGEGGGGRLGSLYGVPRYHSGGLIGAREQLAILQRGEGVFTPGQMQNADRLLAALARPLIQLENELIDALSGRHLLRDRQTQLGSEAQMIEIHLVHQIAQDLLSNAMLNSGERRIQRSQFDNIVQAYEGAGTDLPFADYAQSYRNFWDQVEASGLGALQEMQNSLIQFVETGKFEFSDLTNSILRDLLRISARETITKPLANALGSAVGNLFGLNNVQQGLKGISGIFGGSDSQYSLIPGSSIGATVTTAGGQSIQIGTPHTGGIAGQIKGKRNVVVRDVIKLFNSYHSGGVVGGREELAVLQKGEGVFTPEQMQNANAAFERIRDAQQPAPINVTVMIKTGNGAPKEHRGNFSADGRGGGVVTVDIAEQIEAYIAQRLARGYGPLSMVMRRRR